MYEKLKSKLGEDEAKALLEFIEASGERRATTKEDLQQTQTTLRDELRQTQVTVTEQLHQMQTAFRDELHRLDQKIEATKADIIKWTFGFWIGNMAVLTGIMFTLLRTFTVK